MHYNAYVSSDVFRDQLIFASFLFFPPFLRFGIFLRENEARLRIAAHSEHNT